MSAAQAPGLRGEARWPDVVNCAICKLRLPDSTEDLRGLTLLVSAASEDEWNAFVKSEDQALCSTYMELLNNRIYIVEFPRGSGARAAVAAAFIITVTLHPIARQYLRSIGESFNRAPGLPRYEPDGCLRPARAWLQRLGVGLPAGITYWSDFVTLKLEIGVSRVWGDGVSAGFLDWKARYVWSRFPGVAYVLCIRVDESCEHAEYKCYEIAELNTAPVYIPDAIPIQAPQTLVAFDARRLLGIPAGLPLPPQFPDPFALDLFAVLEEARV